MRVLYAGGFDLLHAGHVAALTAAREIAGPDGTLIVAVNSDQFMEHYKRVPARSDHQRMVDVGATGLADSVILWQGPHGQDQTILLTNPDIYIAGTDWLSKDLAAQLGIPSLAWFDEHAISLMYLRRTPGVSTSQLLAEERKAYTGPLDCCEQR